MAVYSDSHAHLTFDRFDHDLDEVIERARSSGLAWIITISSATDEMRRCSELVRRHEFIRFAAGVHPHEAKTWSAEAGRALREVDRREMVAIGEIGLDYHYDRSPREVQRRAFSEQIHLARELGLPIIVHTREAWEDTFALVREADASKGGVFHCFSGGRREARRVLDLGFSISFAGPVTFANAGPIAEAAAYAPLDRILTETDAPYLSPHPYRGRRNEPARVTLVAERIASLKGLTSDAVGRAATRNLEALFRLTAPPERE